MAKVFISISLIINVIATNMNNSHHDIEDYQKEVVYKFAKDNNFWIDDFNSLGDYGLIGGHENTLVLNSSNLELFKSNNLINKRNLISNLLESIELHNMIFPETKYDLVGFTGIEKEKNRVPYIEVVLKQNYKPNAEQTELDEIGVFMESIGFERLTIESYKRDNIVVYDLYPRNVLKDENGIIYVVDAEFARVDSNVNPEITFDLINKINSIKFNNEFKEVYLNEAHEINSTLAIEQLGKDKFECIDWKQEIIRQKLNASNH